MRTCQYFLLLLLLHSSAHADEPLRFGTFAVPQSPTLAVCEQVLREAYAQLGRQITLEYLPSMRSIYWAKSGRLDGELCRAIPHPPLLMVPTPLAQWQLVAFSNQPLPIHNLADLKGYRVNYLRSIVLVPELAKGLPLTPVNSTKTGLNQLQLKRADVMLHDYYTMLQLTTKLGLPSPVANQPPIFQGQLYHLLNSSHAALAKKLDEQLQSMARSGRIEQIAQEILAPYPPMPTATAEQTNTR